MTLNLPPELQKYVQEQVEAGRYGSAEDVVAAAVARLMQDDRAGDFAPGELDALLAEGEAQLKRGEGVAVEEAFAALRTRSDEFRRHAKTGT